MEKRQTIILVLLILAVLFSVASIVVNVSISDNSQISGQAYYDIDDSGAGGVELIVEREVAQNEGE